MTPITDALKDVVRWHDLKTDPEVFDDVASGAKTHEIRRNDRDFKVGDGLLLRKTRYTGAQMHMRPESCPLEYTGDECRRVVSHVLSGYGLQDGWVILSFAAGALVRAEAGPVRVHGFVWREPDDQERFEPSYTPGRHLSTGELYALVSPTDLPAYYTQWYGQDSKHAVVRNDAAPVAEQPASVDAELLAAIPIAQGDIFMLKKAIAAGDPMAELLFRAEELDRDMRKAIARAESKPATRAEPDSGPVERVCEWIEWHGKVLSDFYPEAEGVHVDVRFRNGSEIEDSPVESWNWRHNADMSDIVAYRITEKARDAE